MSAPMIYHIAERQRWRDAERSDDRRYRAASLQREGFIHCSTRAQLPEVAERLFAGRDDLLLLTVDATRVAAAVVYENLEGGREQYPHVYGAIELDAVIDASDFAADAAGRFTPPGD